jgi:hypothetical protein
MSTAVYSTSPSLTLYGNTQLNSLGNNILCVCTSQILDNTSNKHFHAGCELELASVDLSAQTNPSVELYLIPAMDGTNYVDAGTHSSSADLPPATLFVGNFSVQETTPKHRASVEMITIGPYKYIQAIINKTGAAFAASSNYLRIGTFTEKVA